MVLGQEALMTFAQIVYAKEVKWWHKNWESLSRQKDIKITDKKSQSMSRTMLIKMDWISEAENEESKNMKFLPYDVESRIICMT